MSRRGSLLGAALGVGVMFTQGATPVSAAEGWDPNLPPGKAKYAFDPANPGPSARATLDLIGGTHGVDAQVGVEATQWLSTRGAIMGHVSMGGGLGLAEAAPDRLTLRLEMDGLRRARELGPATLVWGGGPTFNISLWQSRVEEAPEATAARAMPPREGDYRFEDAPHCDQFTFSCEPGNLVNYLDPGATLLAGLLHRGESREMSLLLRVQATTLGEVTGGVSFGVGEVTAGTAWGGASSTP